MLLRLVRASTPGRDGLSEIRAADTRDSSSAPSSNVCGSCLKSLFRVRQVAPWRWLAASSRCRSLPPRHRAEVTSSKEVAGAL